MGVPESGFGFRWLPRRSMNPPCTERVEVGVDRLELSTFRLSSECSNQLSYTPRFSIEQGHGPSRSGRDRSRTGSLLLAKQAFSH